MSSPLFAGWDIFQREYMAGKQLDPTAWKKEQAACSSLWKGLSPCERDRYVAQAAAEQGLREDLARTPWATKEERSSPVSLLPRTAMQCISRQRTLVSWERYKQADWWSSMGCGISCADGILKLDDIDMASADKDLSDNISRFLQQSPDMQETGTDREDIHHTSCFLEQCVTQSHAALARRFVWSMNRMLGNGSWAGIGSIVSCVMTHVS